MIRSYKDLTVWQKAFDLSLEIYGLTKKFPKDEQFGLISQVRRAVVSISSNIAEGYARHRRLEYIQFLQIAYASGAELETQLMLAKELDYLSAVEFEKTNNLLVEVQKMLNVLISKLKSYTSA
jgi:four helix bundle protein